MPRKPCYWTRKLELELVEFVHQREYIWRSFGNTNHHIQRKYKAYAEFAARLGRGFTARSVRDRWVNIRCTFNHNLRRVDKSRETAKSVADIYVPCWPLWKPLQFLKDVDKKEDASYDNYHPLADSEELSNCHNVKEELLDDVMGIGIRQRDRRTDRPRRKTKLIPKSSRKRKCKEVIDGLLQAMKPMNTEPSPDQPHWFFVKHVVQRLNSMKDFDAECAKHHILSLFDGNQTKDEPT